LDKLKRFSTDNFFFFVGGVCEGGERGGGGGGAKGAETPHSQVKVE